MSLTAEDLFYRPYIPSALQSELVLSDGPIRLRAGHIDFILRELLPDPLSGRMRPDDEKWQIMSELASWAGDDVMDSRQGTLWQSNRLVDRQGYIDIPGDWWGRAILLHMAEEFSMRSSRQKDILDEIVGLLAGAEKGS